MDKKINNFDFDFMPIGQAIKKAREAKKVTREQLAEIVDYSARHIQSVENEGQHPSFELFIQLITMFDVSVDELITIFLSYLSSAIWYRSSFISCTSD